MHALVRMKSSTVFWDMMPCSSVDVNQCPRGTYCLHLQGQRVSQASNYEEGGGQQSFACCFEMSVNV
jgi:hypothetical protein